MRISDWSSDVCSSDLHDNSLERPDIGIEDDEVVDQLEHLRCARLLARHRNLTSEGVQQWSQSFDVRRRAGDHNGERSLARRFRTAADWTIDHSDTQIGRASCRERVCQYV